MSVTIRDVARRAGVSVATVSRVFNNANAVNPETLKHVRQVARDIRYFPSAAGRNLSLRSTEAVGMLLPDLFGEFLSEVIRGCDAAVQESRFHLIVSSSHNSREELDAAVAVMRGRIDGLIVMSPHIDAEALAENLPHAMPVVLLNCYGDAGPFDAIDIDNFGGARRMVRHLIRHGHERIAIIKGTTGNIDAFERLRGYRAALAEEGADRDPALELEGACSMASGYDAVRIALGARPRPTAIFASSDAAAIGALSALREAGVHVPAEMALAGFDDIPIGRYLTPALTSVHFGIDTLGALAAETVLHAIREKSRHKAQRVTLPTSLTVRESCGCRKGSDVPA